MIRQLVAADQKWVDAWMDQSFPLREKNVYIIDILPRLLRGSYQKKSEVTDRVALPHIVYQFPAKAGSGLKQAVIVALIVKVLKHQPVLPSVAMPEPGKKEPHFFKGRAHFDHVRPIIRFQGVMPDYTVIVMYDHVADQPAFLVKGSYLFRIINIFVNIGVVLGEIGQLGNRGCLGGKHPPDAYAEGCRELFDDLFIANRFGRWNPICG